MEIASKLVTYPFEVKPRMWQSVPDTITLLQEIASRHVPIVFSWNDAPWPLTKKYALVSLNDYLSDLEYIEIPGNKGGFYSLGQARRYVWGALHELIRSIAVSSIDYGQVEDFKTELIDLERNVAIVEHISGFASAVKSSASSLNAAARSVGTLEDRDLQEQFSLTKRLIDEHLDVIKTYFPNEI
jgi:hypothetical protein